METYLPKEIREGLDAARRKDARRKSRLRVHVGDETFPVLRLWHDGFALALRLRNNVTVSCNLSILNAMLVENGVVRNMLERNVFFFAIQMDGVTAGILVARNLR